MHVYTRNDHSSFIYELETGNKVMFPKVFIDKPLIILIQGNNVTKTKEETAGKYIILDESLKHAE